MVLNRFHISRLRLHFGMILQGRDIQPEPSEKSEALKIILYPRKQGTSSFGGAFVSQGRRAFCMQNVSVKRVFKVQSVFSKTWTNKTRGWHWEHLPSSISGAICQTKGFNVDNLFDRKGIHVGSIMCNKKRFLIKNSCHKRHPFRGHFALKEVASHWEHLS